MAIVFDNIELASCKKVCAVDKVMFRKIGFEQRTVV